MKTFVKSALVGVWFMVLTFPLIGVRVDTLKNTVVWRLDNVLYMGMGVLCVALIGQHVLRRKRAAPMKAESQTSGTGGQTSGKPSGLARAWHEPKTRLTGLAVVTAVMLGMPWVSSDYQINIMVSAMLYVMLGLGLNIVVGYAGQLVLGYVAFYAVGAYCYGLLHMYAGLGFWTVLPLGGILAALFGLMLGFPVLRLKGDYLAIVTLGFGEIVRLVLENWGDVTRGPSGISGIPRPGLFGVELTVSQSATYIYYLVFVAVIVTIIVVNRLKNSRVGLALQALREDEIACEAMGIDLTRTKLSAFALGACWAGFAGVIFAAKTTFINPASFTFMESAMILSIVVLGGMGSTLGVVLGATILILAPEYLRAFSEYRMLIFGAVMVLMMIFRPQGLVSGEKRAYRIKELEEEAGSEQRKGARA